MIIKLQVNPLILRSSKVKMTKVLLLIIFSSFGSLILASNSFTLTEKVTSKTVALNDTVYHWGIADYFEVVVDIDMMNVSDSTNTYTWTKIGSELGTWQVAICDITMCYNTDVKEAQFDLSSGKSGILNAHFYMGGIAGEGFLELMVRNINNPNDTTILVYQAKAYATGVEIAQINHDNFNVYPNPVSNVLTIDYNSKETNIIEIYNILGKKLDKMDANGKLEYSVEHLPNGLYFIKIKDQDNNILTKSFIRN
ncbi:MAG: hypothetical protein COC01_06550 [Bacteroidetes bacterium]|nr:T9SS type A sorting domain-containing protein [Bacteroidia bacterium]PCH67111.1 MAG: hypothetical protein COC01_06550 [Bacteroidota bacterium]